jgi:hypothetical protein
MMNIIGIMIRITNVCTKDCIVAPNGTRLAEVAEVRIPAV